MPAGVQMNHGSLAAHVQWFSCQNDGADDSDIIKWCHEDLSCIEGGNYKKGSTTELEEFGCCYYCHLGVQAQALGSLQSHRPSTSAVWCPSSRKHMPGAQCCLFLDHKHASQPICRTLSYYDFVLSDGDQGGPIPSPLEPGIKQSMDHNALVANCTGRINREQGVRVYLFI